MAIPPGFESHFLAEDSGSEFVFFGKVDESDAGLFQLFDEVNDVEFRLILHRHHSHEDLLKLLTNAFGNGLEAVRFARGRDVGREVAVGSGRSRRRGGWLHGGSCCCCCSVQIHLLQQLNVNVGELGLLARSRRLVFVSA